MAQKVFYFSQGVSTHFQAGVKCWLELLIRVSAGKKVEVFYVRFSACHLHDQVALILGEHHNSASLSTSTHFTEILDAQLCQLII